jgi:hypothetical protein
VFELLVVVVELFKADRNSVGHCGVVCGYTEI